MSNKGKAIPPKPIGKVAVEEKFTTPTDYVMAVNFRQDREEYILNPALAKRLKFDSSFYVSKENYRNCFALNRFLKQLIDETGIDNEVDTVGNPDVIQAKSLFVFIIEASEHPEYCTPYMLRKFSNCIFTALEEYIPTVEDIVNGNTIPGNTYGFRDYSDDIGNQKPDADAHLRFMSLLHSITPEMLRAIHNKEHKPNSDLYRCQSDNYIHILIQICYSILMHYFRNGDIIRICDNCRRIFIPRRANDKYCTMPAPEDAESENPKSCGQYMKYQKQRIHNDSDEFKKEHDRILRRLDSSETEDFIKEYKETKGNPEARRQMLERWAEKYPPRRKKGEAK